jgi:hypothetical protein
MFTKAFLATAAGMALLAAAPAVAATAAITSVVGTWVDPNPNVAGVDVSNGADRSTIAWGYANFPGAQHGEFGGRSGYVFDGRDPMEAGMGSPFAVGALTHENWPIRDPALDSVGLDVTIKGFLPSGAADPTAFEVTTRIDFSHYETMNWIGPCEFGGTPGVGLNKDGCADEVTVSPISLTQKIEHGGKTYLFELLGLSNGASSFLTRERGATSIDLMAQISAVPGPAPVALLLGAFGALGWTLRRRRGEAAA